MEVIYPSCCGIDVHAKSVVVCLIKKGRKQTRTYSTMTYELLKLSDWLLSEDCAHAAIESTGVYWKPVFTSLKAYSKLSWSTPAT
jgi:transposase